MSYLLFILCIMYYCIITFFSFRFSLESRLGLLITDISILERSPTDYAHIEEKWNGHLISWNCHAKVST
jgi:hypothetical protein